MTSPTITVDLTDESSKETARPASVINRMPLNQRPIAILSLNQGMSRNKEMSAVLTDFGRKLVESGLFGAINPIDDHRHCDATVLLALDFEQNEDRHLAGNMTGAFFSGFWFGPLYGAVPRRKYSFSLLSKLLVTRWDNQVRIYTAKASGTGKAHIQVEGQSRRNAENVRLATYKKALDALVFGLVSDGHFFVPSQSACQKI